MDAIPNRALALSLAAALVGCSGPFLTLPGGELEGVRAEIPSSWDFTNDISTIQVETNPADPYSINIWATALNGHLYLHAGTNRANWVEHLEADPRTRARIEDKIYELSATRVRDAEEFERFAVAYEAKYGNRPRNENVEEVYAYRLTAR